MKLLERLINLQENNKMVKQKPCSVAHVMNGLNFMNGVNFLRVGLQTDPRHSLLTTIIPVSDARNLLIECRSPLRSNEKSVNRFGIDY